MGFGASFVCYAGKAEPDLTGGLRRAVRLGCARLVVFPFFLFVGVFVLCFFVVVVVLLVWFLVLVVFLLCFFGVFVVVVLVFLERAREGLEGRANMNCSLCKYRVQIVGFEEQVGTPQQPHHVQVRARRPFEGNPAPAKPQKYQPHPIEAESFRIIEAGRDWSGMQEGERRVAQRLVHTSGDFEVVEELFFSPGAVDIGMRALLRCRRIVTDVSMVASWLKRSLLEQLGVDVWCGVHDRETHMLSAGLGITRSAAGVRRAWEKWGNDIILAIGDAPTAIMEATRLIREAGWRPQLVVGLPVGFVGTRGRKDELRRGLQVPRLTNSGTRGGSPWAASVVNAIMIGAVDHLAGERLA